MQDNCNREGFHAIGGRDDRSKARIGLLGNKENDCSSPNSRIGFGTGGDRDDYNTCGNKATHQPDNGHIKAIGYIFVQ